MCSLGPGDNVRGIGFALREREQGAGPSFVKNHQFRGQFRTLDFSVNFATFAMLSLLKCSRLYC